MDLERLAALLKCLRKYGVTRFAGSGSAYPFDITLGEEPAALDKTPELKEAPELSEQEALERDLFLK